MKLIKGNIKRCGIFLYYDKEGKVDDYVIYLLECLKKNIDDLLIVCNGKIPPESEAKFRALTDDILVRANVGFDVGGYREGIFHYGFERLSQYDEIVLLNYTFFGPMYPFEEMFDEMAERDLDFWGITGHFAVHPDPYGQNRYGYLPEHIQSHFLVLRRSMILSDEYREFIINMKNPASYVESICDYESILAKYFTDLGFQGDVYCDASEYEGYVFNPVMFRLKDMLEKQRCPIIKRRSFFTDYQDFMLNSCGEVTAEAYDYIREHLLYDTNLIWDNLLRLENMTEISRAMQLNYILPEKEILQQYCPFNKIAVFVVEYSDKFKSVYDAQLNEVLSGIDCYRINGNTESSYGKLLADIIYKAKGRYDYVGIVEVKNVECNPPYSNRVSWQYSDWKNILPSREYISNVFATFDENERLGMLIPPSPEYGNLFEQRQDGWFGRYQQVAQYLQEQHICVNIKEQDEPLAPAGGSFWLRMDAVGTMTEPLPIDKVEDELQALLTLPFLIQADGYYIGTVYNMEYTPIAVTNQDYMMRELNKTVFDKYGPSFHTILVDRIKTNEFLPIKAQEDAITKKNQISAIIGKCKHKIKKMIKYILPYGLLVVGKKIYYKMRGIK